MDEKENLLLNLDKKMIFDPASLTLSGQSDMFSIALVQQQIGNPFQYELFHLLMDAWKGDRITLVNDSKEARDYLTQQEDYTYYKNYKNKYRRRIRDDQGIKRITIEPKEMKRWARRWKEFVNQYVLINYDSYLYMTLDERLFKQSRRITPYFVLAQAESREDSEGSWAANRIGIEPIGTSTFDKGEYLEMFRMIGDKTAIQLEKEDMERRMGLRD